MFDDTHYVPILKGRPAEYEALKEVDAKKGLLTPLIEITPIGWDFAEEKPTSSIDDHLINAEKRLEAAWGTERRTFIDLIWIDRAMRCAGDEHPLAFILRRGSDLDLRLVPVVTMDSDAPYRQAIKTGHRDLGACLRLRSSDLITPQVGANATALLTDLGLDMSDVDLIVDLKELNAREVDFNVLGALGVISQVPSPDAWRSFSVAGASFPENLSEMQPSTEKRFERAEWAIWNALRERDLPRSPTFADYTINHPEPPAGLDPRLMRISAQLRYTAETDWLVFKERNIRDYGSEQFVAICKRLIARDEFSGADFSWGDRYIFERGTGEDTRPGNPMMWRKVGTNHHLLKVLSQIASLDT